MTDSIHPHRSEFDALKQSIDERFAEQNVMILSHNEAVTRRGSRQEKTIEAMRDSMQTIADQLNAMVKDYSDTKRVMQKQDLDHAEEKGAILAKMAQQERAAHERFNQSDLNIIQQNGEIAKINAKLNEIIPVVVDFKEAARVILEEQKDRKRAEERSQKQVAKLEVYSKAIVALGIVTAFITGIIGYIAKTAREAPQHESVSPKSSRFEKVYPHRARGRYACLVRTRWEDAGQSVLYVT